jgi:hypothetical protein
MSRKSAPFTAVSTIGIDLGKKIASIWSASIGDDIGRKIAIAVELRYPFAHACTHALERRAHENRTPVPTARESDVLDNQQSSRKGLRRYGHGNVTVEHEIDGRMRTAGASLAEAEVR